MPPAQKRNVDDSRSETSSSIPNQKDIKTILGPTSSSGVSKGKRLASGVPNGSSLKAPVNGVAAPTSTSAAVPAASDKDPNLPRTDWVSIPNSILRTYRIAYRLPVPSTFSQPHADIIYNSSNIALRAPSAILARRRLRDQKHQKRKLDHFQSIGATTKGSKSRGRDRNKEKEKNRTKDVHLDASSTTGSTIAQSIEPPDPTQGGDQTQPHSPSSPSSTSTTFLGPREPSSQLAIAVRKHFNAQQLSEADTIARFTYVVQESGRPVWTEGAEGDGAGNWMGSHGREVRKVDGPGGEVGFRLRFRP